MDNRRNNGINAGATMERKSLCLCLRAYVLLELEKVETSLSETKRV